MRMFSYLFVLLICVDAAVTAEQQVFHLQNGKRLLGEIVEERGDDVVIDTRDGRVTLRRSEIEGTSPYPVDLDDLKAADQAVADRRHIDAITFLRRAYSDADAPELRQEEERRIAEVVENWVSRSQSRSGSEVDWSDADRLLEVEGFIESATALEKLKAEVRRIREVRARHLLSVADRHIEEREYEQAEAIYRELARHGYPQPKKLARTYLNHAKSLLRPPRADPSRALRLLQRAVEQDPSIPEVQVYLAQAYLELDEVGSAEKALREAHKHYERLSALEKSVFDKVSGQLARASRFPTFAPIPTVSPEQIVQHQQEKKKEIDYWWRRLKWLYGTGKWKQIIFENWLIGVAALAALLILWYFPWRYVRRDYSRRTMTGPNWSTVAFLTGVLGLLMYLIARAIQEGRKVRCKRCGYNLSRVGDYMDYDFAHCPGCRAPIKPVFSLDQIIVARANQLMSGVPVSTVDMGGEEELFYLLCLHAFRSRAEQMQLQPDGKEIAVTLTIDGVPRPVFKLPGPVINAVLPSARKKGNIDSSSSYPQTGYFVSSMDDADVEVHLTITPGDLGESMELRLLDRREGAPGLSQLGLDEKRLTVIQEELEKDSGAIVVAGPPRSGRSTLVYAMLQHLNDGRHYIVTLENPIHLDLPGVTQVTEGQGGIRGRQAVETALRQNPDVLFVDRVEDRESVELLLRSATGNRRSVLCLETQDSIGALKRFLSNELDAETLSSGLSMVIAVRLIRKLCPSCKTEAKLRGRDAERLGLSHEQAAGVTLFVHKGCDACTGTGYRGRTGVFEILPITDTLKNALRAGQNPDEILRLAASDRIGSIREHAMRKVVTGVTDLDEVARVLGMAGNR